MCKSDKHYYSASFLTYVNNLYDQIILFNNLSKACQPFPVINLYIILTFWSLIAYQWTVLETVVLCDVSENVYQIGEVLPAARQPDPEGWEIFLRLWGRIRWSWVTQKTFVRKLF